MKQQNRVTEKRVREVGVITKSFSDKLTFNQFEGPSELSDKLVIVDD